MGEKKGREKELYKDIGTSSWQIVREILCEGTAKDWAPVELQGLAKACFGGSASTRECLEMPFGWLKDSLRASKAQKASVWTRWLYLLVNPYCREGGIKQVLPDSSDFMQLLQQGFKDETLLSAHPFNPLKTKIGNWMPRPGAVKDVRPAGYHTNRVAAAGMALCVASASSDFVDVGRAWAGLHEC